MAEAFCQIRVLLQVGSGKMCSALSMTELKGCVGQARVKKLRLGRASHACCALSSDNSMVDGGRES